MVTGPLGSVAGEPDRRQRQLLCLLPVQVAGAWQVRRCVCSAHGPSPQTQVQATAAGVTLLPAAYNRFSGDGLPNSAFHLSSSIFLGESLRKGSQHCFILRDILFRGNYVTNRCPGSARNSGSAAAGPGNGSRLVKNASVGPGTGFPRSLLPAAQHIVLQRPERVEIRQNSGTSFARAMFR